jgi:methylated-DNA-[protein]-cysteine S-methyltransferase
MIHYFNTYDTSFGPFSIAVDGDDAVTATAFGGTEALRSRLGPGAQLQFSDRAGATAAQQVSEYCRGERRRFHLRLAAVGSAFQQRVWAALVAIRWGQTRSYGALARELGSSARAIGRANATNPICLIVPCHRVIGSDGSLTGFAFGEDLKRQLLKHEAMACDPLPRTLGDGDRRVALAQL